MLYVERKFKRAIIDLEQYIHILFVLNFIFEWLFVSDIVAEKNFLLGLPR
jgi:hypothetical protein